jgi:hypothetical protein
MTGTPSPSWLRSQRLRSQLLDGRGGSALDVVRRLGAVQAQNATAARWAVGVRATDAGETDVEHLFVAGDVVRSWTMRGTLHIVAAEDLGWMLSLTSARQRSNVAREASLRGITDADFERASELIAADVAENGPRTRAETLPALERAGIEVGNERGYRLIRDAALRGLVAWGPLRGKQPQLVTVPQEHGIERDEALARFLTRYLAGHAPATVRDFAWWSGLTLTDARRALEVAGHDVEVVGADHWLALPGNLHEEPPTSGKSSTSDIVQATPAWDEYVLGYRDRSPVLDPAFALRVSPTGNGVFLPTIVSSGRVVGTWRQSLEGRRLVAEAEPFTRLTASERRGFDASIDRLARFLGVARV